MRLRRGSVIRSFLALEDTPASYAGQALKSPRVNAGANALEFAAGVGTFLGLTDTPAAYTDQAGKAVRVNVGEDALEFGAVAGVPGEGRILILTPSYDSIGQGTWAFAMSVEHFLNFTWHNGTKADGDNVLYKAYLDAGTYTLLFYFCTTSDQGIVDIDIDGVEVASVDLYSGATVYGVTDRTTGIVIGAAGLKTITMRLDGKHASSSGYMTRTHAIVLWRTA